MRLRRRLVACISQNPAIHALSPKQQDQLLEILREVCVSSDFKKFWIGQTISNLGSSFTQWAVPLLVYQLTHSAVSLGIATAATFLPYLLFGLLIGAWMDRVDRKRAMIALDSAERAS